MEIAKTVGADPKTITNVLENLKNFKNSISQILMVFNVDPVSNSTYKCERGAIHVSENSRPVSTVLDKSCDW